MAYPTVSGPFGLVPVKMVDGATYTGAQRSYKIESGNATAIFNGDLVAIDTDGFIDRVAAGDDIDYVGVFVGVSYTDPTFGLTFRNSYPGNITADDITAFVVDGDNVLYKVAVVDSNGDVSGIAQSEIGNNVGLDDQSPVGNTTTGRSNMAVDDASHANTATLPLRVVQGVEETKDSSGNFTEILVKFNAGHQLSTATGAGDA